MAAFHWGYCQKKALETPHQLDLSVDGIRAEGDLVLDLAVPSGHHQGDLEWVSVGYDFQDQPLWSFRQLTNVNLASGDKESLSLHPLLLSRYLCRIRIQVNPFSRVSEKRYDNNWKDVTVGLCEEERATRFPDLSLDGFWVSGNQQQTGFVDLEVQLTNRGNRGVYEPNESIGFHLKLLDAENETIYQLRWKRQLPLPVGEGWRESARVPDEVFSKACTVLWEVNPTRRVQEMNYQNNYIHQSGICEKKGEESL